MSSAFALIDCNNFFVACEQLFRPDLLGRAIVVLSSNDGCVVSRSREAKALGIPMGAPAYKYQDTFKRHGVVSFSANFELYGDISHRLTGLLTSLNPRTEVYSVDESFLELNSLRITNYRAWAESLRRRIHREVGVTVSIGLGGSKTLAKLATTAAKKVSDSSGTLDLLTINPDERDRYLRATEVSDVWGVGRRLSPRLRAEGIHTALDLKGLRPRLAASLLGVHGRRLVAELSGTSCLPIEVFGRTRQSISHGRVFGSDNERFEVIEAAIATLTARAASRLRNEGLLATSACLQLSTNRHKPNYTTLSRFINLSSPSADSGQLASSLIDAIKDGFKQGASYHRVNVTFYNLLSRRFFQADLLGLVDLGEAQKSQARMVAIDQLNGRYGGQTVHYAAQDLSHDWQPKKEHCSPRYTSDWQELPKLH